MFMEFLNIGFILQSFFSFFAIMNPIGNTPIFLSLVSNIPESDHRKVAFTGVLTAFLIVLLFTVGGNLIFRFFGITLPAFRIAGGILVFMIARNLLKAKKSYQHHPTEEEIEEDIENIAITPLATPILAGPGTITTALSLVGKKSDLVTIVTVISVFGIVCLITYFCFIYGDLLTKKLKPSAIGVMTRLMGLILAVVAVQMIIEGSTDIILQIAKKLAGA